MPPKDGKPDYSAFQYSAMASLVTTADRSNIPRRDNEPTGEAESLVGRINPKDMGSRVARSGVADLDGKRKKADKEREKREKRELEGAPKRRTATSALRYGDVLEATQDLEGLDYRPRTAETRQVYELMLSAVHTLLGDSPPSMVRSAADVVLGYLKDDSLKDLDKKREIDALFSSTVPTDVFAQLVTLGKKITDYGEEEEKGAKDEDDAKEGEIDDDVGVAVVFEEEEEEEEDEEGFEVRDSDSDSDEDSDEDEQAKEADEMVTGDVDEDDGEENVIIGGAGTSSSKKSGAADGVVSAREIDGFWLQRLIAQSYADPVEAAEKTTEAMALLSSEANKRDVENSLMDLTDYDKFELVSVLIQNRDKIVWCTKLARSDENEKIDVEVAMREKGAGWILKELRGDVVKPSAGGSDDANAMDVDSKANSSISKKGTLAPGGYAPPPGKTLDLEAMAFSQGGRLMSNKKCKLPEGSFKRSKKGYEEVHVPAPKKPTREAELVPISALPEWAQPTFKGTTSLNPVQSRLYPIAFGTDEPILLCAPTGAGKTNAAMLTILNELSKHRNEVTGEFDFSAFKIVYVAPMKALVQEMVGNFSKRLAHYGVVVNELTGDRQLTKQQIAETQIIVTTPEKWDVITRKSTDTSYTNLVSLIIIDEIHLLHDDRGPVLESIIARTIRRMEQTHNYVRLVGLSATLPNYKDVAKFLHVDPEKGLFYFDASYRPCPLKQEFIGVTEKKAIKRYQVTNEICYEKVLEHAGKNQVIIFVHSRKETAKTARFLRDHAVEMDTITHFLRADPATREILTSEAETVADPNLRDLLPFGLAIHHAGMNREDRTLVEDLFADGRIQVLVSTATLAWGVNLPAHVVIIKGTQVYNPEKGRWVELSSQDVLQMLGRAGRPQYDTFGEGIIITNHSELQYYLSMMNHQLPIESQFVSRLADNLNAEIVLGTVRNRDEAVQWLSYTYLYVRMLGSPALYSVSPDFRDDDPYLIQKRSDIIHTAAVLLEKNLLIRYDRRSGVFHSNELGRIASGYYVTYTSMGTYNQHLKSASGLIELFRVFSISEEFKNVPVRAEEKLELAKLLERVPIPIKESVDDPSAKINVLLQSYISNLKLDGFALVADMVYVTQSAGRILRAIFEICLKRGWAALTHKALALCQMVEKRMWGSMTPLRQFKGVPTDVIRRAERKEFPWYRYFDLEPAELGELIGEPKAGRLVHRLVHQFPKLELQAHVQPITRTMLRIELTITPDFQWDEKVHSGAEAFWILVEDVDGEIILYHDQFLLRQRYAEQDHYVTFTVPLLDPLPPNYFISVVSDRWLHAETRLPLSFKHLILPDKFPPPTTLLDLQPLPVSALHNREFEAIYASTPSFNKIQTQVFQALYASNENIFVGAPTGSGKTICAEFALLRLWSQPKATRAICIEPFQDVVDMRVAEWKAKFGDVQGGKEIVALTGETSADIRLLEKGDVIVCTPSQWDLISRRWKQRKNVQTIGLLIADEIQLVGGEIGPTYEVIVSRTRYVQKQTENPTRIVAFSVSLANARDVGEWMGATSQTIFNFSPGARPLPMEVHIQSFNVPHFPSLMIQMAKPAYLAIVEYAQDRPVLCFVPSRKQCRLSADDILTYCLADQEESRFLNIDAEELAPHLAHVTDSELKATLEHGIGFYHEALSKQDKRIVEHLFSSGAIQVVVASKDTAWSIPLTAYMVVIMGVQAFEGKEHRYIDYPLTDVLQMMGRACRPTHDASSRCVLMCQQVRKDFFKKFLNEGLPIESHLHLSLHDHFNAEIVTKTIENKQDAVDWLTWTWMYRRLVANANYYNMQGTTHRHLSDHLSELVESTLTDLQNSKAITIEDEMDTSALNLGMIAAYYNISYVTVDIFSMSLTDKTKLKGLLEIVSSASEFENIPIRHHEDVFLRKVYDRVPVKLANVDYDSPHFKTNVLLQAHFARLSLPADLAADQTVILTRVLNLLSACVDVMSSNAYLNALGAMELSQMCVQGMWDSDSPLKQIPGFTKEVIDRCSKADVRSVYDIMELEDEQRDELLRFDARQMREVAKVCNAYPSIELSHEVQDKDELSAGTSITLVVNLEREVDEGDEVDQKVPAPFFPVPKIENWWLVVGEPKTKQLLSIKKVTVQRDLSVKLDFTLPQGSHDLKLYFVSDSHLGADQEHEIPTLQVAEAEDSDENDDDDDDDDMEE
ncbi:pre-mRNA splicing factor [Microbotryum lychnidis-dioicae p1A1 Lamole]|uniref:RNA helicase n=1 Tax=Microbotryum lychnidis-dioicae (strain p1A1 Lamole / MvSl-1064) TaxID=683840 RepID=U5H900_USTV1|nr:pre-mRNA splicing factor [Microbotryum lychnidis-dioicae p1A1 Lamole]|eukprot:KDE06013.1 pre-mRNA splicing factor [Microbotryum lychnidis-dioicae p1A1 Lamole]